MDTGRLELFSDIAQTLNLTETAERLGYTQSGVSHAIKKLENEIGTTLLVRTNRGVELTRDAEKLLPYIRLVVSHTRRLDEMINELHGLSKGTLCIGAYQSVAMHWLPFIINRFKEKYPGIQIRLMEGGLGELEEWIDDGRVDFAFLSWRKKQPFKFIALARDPMYAVTSNSFVLPKKYKGVFPMKEFHNHTFIAAETGIDIDVANAMHEEGLVSDKNFLCRDDHTIIHIIESGAGVSLLSGMILKGYEHRVQTFPTKPAHMRTIGIGLKSDRNLTISARAFIETTHEMIGDLLPQPSL